MNEQKNDFQRLASMLLNKKNKNTGDSILSQINETMSEACHRIKKFDDELEAGLIVSGRRPKSTEGDKMEKIKEQDMKDVSVRDTMAFLIGIRKQHPYSKRECQFAIKCVERYGEAVKNMQ